MYSNQYQAINNKVSYKIDNFDKDYHYHHMMNIAMYIYDKHYYPNNNNMDLHNHNNNYIHLHNSMKYHNIYHISNYYNHMKIYLYNLLLNIVQDLNLDHYNSMDYLYYKLLFTIIVLVTRKYTVSSTIIEAAIILYDFDL